MLGSKMDLSSCVIWTGFHKSSHILCTEFEPKVSTATATTYLFIIVVHYLLHHKLTTAPENSMSNVTASIT